MSPTDHFADDEHDGPWTLAQIYDDLGSRDDVARALNVTRSRMHDWMRRRETNNSPHPIKRIGHVDVYSIQEWRDWLRRWEAAHADNKQFQKVKPHNSAGVNFWEYLDRDTPTQSE